MRTMLINRAPILGLLMRMKTTLLTVSNNSNATRIRQVKYAMRTEKKKIIKKISTCELTLCIQNAYASLHICRTTCQRESTLKKLTDNGNQANAIKLWTNFPCPGWWLATINRTRLIYNRIQARITKSHFGSGFSFFSFSFPFFCLLLFQQEEVLSCLIQLFELKNRVKMVKKKVKIKEQAQCSVKLII